MTERVLCGANAALGTQQAAATSLGWTERQIRRADRFQQRHPMISFPVAVLQKFSSDRAGARATLIAYYGFFAVFPLLLLFVTVLPRCPALRAELASSALQNLPVLEHQLRPGRHPAAGHVTALVLGIAGTLYGMLGIGVAAQNAMNTVWNIPFAQWPGFWRRYARALGFLLVLGLPCVSATAFTALAATLPGHAKSSVLIVELSAVVNFGMFLLAFMLLAAEPLRISDVAPGALFATLSWEVMQLIGTWYISRQLHSTSATDSYFAIVVTLLSWLYLGAQLTLWAAEVNVVLHYHLWPRSILHPPG